LEGKFREGVLVKPYERLDAEQIKRIDAASMSILAEPGVWCHNERAANLYKENGAKVWEEKEYNQTVWRVSLPEGLVRECLEKAPSSIVLGARNPENRLLLDSEVPRVYFGSGSETNVWLETEMEEFASTSDPDRKIKYPKYTELRGNTGLLERAARLADRLEHLDFFIRPVNIQDEGIDENNHDVNKFFASLNNITKHVQAGLTTLDKLDDVLHMAEIAAGGKEELRENPVISFITCFFKSPLQIVEDTADKVFSIVEAGMPLVMSSSPQGGSSAPIQEAGMVAQINAEIIAGITITQLIRPGAPVLYGSVPVRARFDNLHDLYGCPEFVQYNIDCVQMARSYKVPCYSSAGVGDAKTPGMQAMYEKLFTQMNVAMSGPQYIHYAFGLLDRTNTFCPVQAVLDNEQIGAVKHCLRGPKVDEASAEKAVKMVNKVMSSSNRMFTRHARGALRSGEISEPYRFESPEGGMVIEKAVEHLAKLEAEPARHMDADTVDRIFSEVPGILDSLKKSV